MPIYQIDPISDGRWPGLLERDCRASVFHTRGWLEALRRSYGYEPVVFTTSAPARELTDGVVFCRVNSWLTGNRMVSLPFSDHCEPILNEPDGGSEILSHLLGEVESQRLKYVEFRPLTPIQESANASRDSEKFCFHKLDLRPGTDDIFRALHKDSIRRKIQRAERELLVYEKGNDQALLEKFYRLFVMTRRRHGLPPSPLHWFQNLLSCLGEKAQIRIASKGNVPVAGLFTLTHNKSIVYKYGGSDMALSNLGGTPFLFWRTIVEAKAEGLHELDLGRSDLNNEGLITFKERLGGVRSLLTYRRLSRKAMQPSHEDWKSRLAKRMFAYTSDHVRIQVGNLLYRHLG
jgi:Acetyltransferase (GNAT) domain